MEIFRYKLPGAIKSLLRFCDLLALIIWVILGITNIKRFKPYILNEQGSLIEELIISIDIEVSVTTFPLLETLKKSELIPILKYYRLVQILSTSYDVDLTFVIDIIDESDN